MEPSPTWEEFIADVRAGGSSRSITYDTVVFDKLQGAELDAAIALLLIQARDERDVRAIETLSALGLDLLDSVEVPEDPSPLRSAWLRNAATVRPSDEATTALAEDAALGVGMMSTSLSVAVLRDTPGDLAAEALVACLDAPYRTARIHAWEGLIDRLGLRDWESPAQSPLATLLTLKDCRIPSAWQGAADRFRSLLVRLGNGADPDDAGLVYNSRTAPALLARVWTSLEDRDGPADTLAILRLRGHDRAAAEARLLFEFSVFYRPRALEALLELQPPALLEWLTEQLIGMEEAGIEPVVAASIREALELLRS